MRVGLGVALGLLVVSIAGTWATEKFTFNHELSPAGAEKPYLRMNGEDDLQGGIFRHHDFDVTGKVGRLEFFALRTGKFFVDVWSFDAGTFICKLLYSHPIEVTKTGYQEHILRTVEKMHVELGRVIGIHYDSTSSHSVLSMDHSGKPTQGLMSDWMPIGRDVAIGQTLTFSPAPGRRSPDIKFIVEGPPINMRLYPDGFCGRAEILTASGEWSTICDLWFHVKGWPNLFCTELGYPGAEIATYVNDPSVNSPPDWNRYQVPWRDWPTVPTLNNPRCKRSQGQKFSTCERVDRFCSHRQDVFVKCLPRVRCAHEWEWLHKYKGFTTWSIKCVPEIYVDGEWGYVSESRNYESFKDNNNTWMAAFCKTIGSENVKKVEFATSVGNYKGDKPVLKCNPDCLVENPTKMEQCPPGPYGSHCTTDNVPFIMCEITRLTNWHEVLQAEREAKVAERAAAQAGRQAKAATKAAERMLKYATIAAQNQATNKARKAANDAKRLAVQADRAAAKTARDVRRIEDGMDRFESKWLRETDRIAKRAKLNAERMARQAHVAAQKAQNQANSAARRAGYKKAGTPEQEEAERIAEEAAAQAEQMATLAIQLADAAMEEADRITAAAKEHAMDKIEAAEKEAKKDIREALNAVRKAERQELAAANKAKRVATYATRWAVNQAKQAARRAARIIAEAQRKFDQAEAIAQKEREEADAMVTKRYDQNYEEMAW